MNKVELINSRFSFLEKKIPHVYEQLHLLNKLEIEVTNLNLNLDENMQLDVQFETDSQMLTVDNKKQISKTNNNN